MKVAGVLIVSVALIDLTYQWSYETEDEWPGACQHGSRQSPINIITRDAVVDSRHRVIRSEMVYRGYSNVDVTARNNGHTLKWNLVPGGPTPIVSGGPLSGNYTLLQFHLHWLSEHGIDGLKYPAEIHLVHVKTGMTIDQAKELDDGIAVIGILCEVKDDKDSDHALEEIMAMIPNLLEPSEEESSTAEILDISRFMSSNPQSFYTYEGSLTTPSCDEAVIWILMDTPITMSSKQYKLLSKVHVGGVSNYRSIQPTNRIVYKSATSCSSLMLPGYLSLISLLYHCSKIVLHKTWCKIWASKETLFGIDNKCGVLVLN